MAKWYWVEQLFDGEGLPFSKAGARWQAKDLSNSDGQYAIKTLEGWRTVYWKNWVVKVANGVFRVYTPREFKKEYYFVD